MKSHHETRLRPTTSVRDSYRSAVDQLAQLETAGTFEPVPANLKAKKSKPAKKTKGKR